jgi:pimeloyl-ACP methyl ester carboxylesterase
MARAIHTTEVNPHFYRHEVPRLAPWPVLLSVRCPVPAVEEMASQLPADTTRLVRLPGARHSIFRDRPDLAYPAVTDFVRQASGG